MSDFITNAELRIEAERLCDENERLVAENAKLRELVRDMWLAANIADIKVCVKDGDWRTLGERVYEALGIEVDA